VGKGPSSKGSHEIVIQYGGNKIVVKWFPGVHWFPMDLYRMFVAAADGCIQPGLKARPIRGVPS